MHCFCFARTCECGELININLSHGYHAAPEYVNVSNFGTLKSEIFSCIIGMKLSIILDEGSIGMESISFSFLVNIAVYFCCNKTGMHSL